jgi:hypothetical protein
VPCLTGLCDSGRYYGLGPGFGDLFYLLGRKPVPPGPVPACRWLPRLYNADPVVSVTRTGIRAVVFGLAIGEPLPNPIETPRLAHGGVPTRQELLGPLDRRGSLEELRRDQRHSGSAKAPALKSAETSVAAQHLVEKDTRRDTSVLRARDGACGRPLPDVAAHGRDRAPAR